jgi:hypothetical protein
MQVSSIIITIFLKLSGTLAGIKDVIRFFYYILITALVRLDGHLEMGLAILFVLSTSS